MRDPICVTKSQTLERHTVQGGSDKDAPNRSKFPFALESKSPRVSSAIYNELGKLLQNTTLVCLDKFRFRVQKIISYTDLPIASQHVILS